MAQREFVAAIDIGTNSMHLVVARLADHGGFDILDSEKDTVRLGQGGGEMKHLAPEAIDRGIAALARLRAVAGSFGDTEIVAVATSAIREAINKRQFLDRARDEVGVNVEVISGFEEARLIYLGILQALPVFDRRMLAVDIGGGSTELCVGKSDQVIEARSMKLGAIRLTERFFSGVTDDDRDGSVERRAAAACRDYVRSALAPVAHELSGHQPEIVVGSSGTITTLATMALAAANSRPRQLNGAVLHADALRELVAEITARTTEQRLDLPGLDDKRVDIIVAGSILLDEIFRAFDIVQMTVSEAALREGVLYDRFGRSAGQQVSDVRRTNVLRLARQLDPDPAHAEHTAQLATQLFDRTARLHGLGDHPRELLEAAAIVHNVGLFISHSSHHRHSYYVVRNSEQLTGFTEHEIELIAVIARYHRKSLPSKKHDEFAALSSADRRLVRVLAGLLRIAIGLDRRHAASVRSVRVFVDGDSVLIEPVGETDGDLHVEIYAARERSALLSKALGADVSIEAPTPIESDALSS